MGFNSFFAELHFARGLTCTRQGVLQAFVRGCYKHTTAGLPCGCLGLSFTAILGS